ncbi:MAG: type II toxin-antitoxin system VapB family antitoxin [Novosphingobium sp.]|nr:type II toxin-antitoxin system VapB family antitoxin [Novosphingobium sp.]
MRTNIVIDDRLMADTLEASGARTKRAAIEEAMRFFVRLRRQERARELFGTVTWIGDLDEMRRD